MNASPVFNLIAYRAGSLLNTTPEATGLQAGEVKRLRVNLNPANLMYEGSIRAWVDGGREIYEFNVNVNSGKKTHVKCSLC